jgi:hypothetical protein
MHNQGNMFKKTHSIHNLLDLISYLLAQIAEFLSVMAIRYTIGAALNPFLLEATMQRT